MDTRAGRVVMLVYTKVKLKGGQQDEQGISYHVAAFFIVAQMAGAGFLSLPAALANTGWFGLPMMLLFCLMVGFTATRLGYCWNILEERWPEEYSKPARQPYMEIAYRAFGKHGRRVSCLSVLVSQFGATSVFIILAAQQLARLVPQLNTCFWVLVVGLVLTPCTWLGTPRDFWQGPVLAVVSTVLACIVIVVQVIVDASEAPDVQFASPTWSSFALGFGTILFAYGGSSAFPTIQNDMANRRQFWKSVILALTCVLVLYVPVSVAGYAVFGYTVDSNILFEVSQGAAVKAAMSLQIINLLGTFVIGFNTVSQAAEEYFNVPTHLNWKRIVCRTAIIAAEVIICLAIPDFYLILNLIGASAMSICTFILPPLMYLRLCTTGPVDTRRAVPRLTKAALAAIALVGVVGGVSSTIIALYDIVTTPFSLSCLVHFQQTTSPPLSHSASSLLSNSTNSAR